MGHSGDVELPAMPNVPLLTDHILLCIDQHLIKHLVSPHSLTTTPVTASAAVKSQTDPMLVCFSMLLKLKCVIFYRNNRPISQLNMQSQR